MSEINISEQAKALFDKLDILAFNDASSHECLTAIQLAINSATALLNKRIEDLEKLLQEARAQRTEARYAAGWECYEGTWVEPKIPLLSRVEELEEAKMDKVEKKI